MVSTVWQDKLRTALIHAAVDVVVLLMIGLSLPC